VSGCITVVNYNNWQQAGDTSIGNWQILNGGNYLYQADNSDPTFYVTSYDLINVEINGKVKITDTSNVYIDDDFIGFVFGLQDPLTAPWYNYDFWLFDWRAGNQTINGQTAYEGFTLDHVTGNYPDSTSRWNAFFAHNAPGFDVYQANYDTTSGWEFNTVYDVKLIYTNNKIWGIFTTMHKIILITICLLVWENMLEAKTFEENKIGCKAGEAKACSDLGVMYEYGKEVKHDSVKAKSVWEKACKLGETRACFNLGVMYHQGTSMKKNSLKAIKCYTS